MGKHKREKDMEDYFKKKLKKLEEKIDKMRGSREDGDRASTNVLVDEIIETEPDQPELIEDEPELVENQPEVCAEVLELLGDSKNENINYGPAFNKVIAERWTTLLQGGLDKTIKKEVMDCYAVPENCHLVEAPLLNPEVVAAAAESNLFRDNMLLAKQKQLGKGIAALGTGLTKILEMRDPNLEIIKHLSNAGRILCDLFQTETNSRRNLMLTSLNKDMKDAVKNIPADKWLFGESLTDRIKNQKAITKSATDIKKKPVQQVQKKPVATTAKNNLNWKGPLKPRAAAPASTPYRSQQPSSGPRPSQQKYRHHYNQTRQSYRSAAPKRRY